MNRESEQKQMLAIYTYLSWLVSKVTSPSDKQGPLYLGLFCGSRIAFGNEFRRQKYFALSRAFLTPLL